MVCQYYFLISVVLIVSTEPIRLDNEAIMSSRTLTSNQEVQYIFCVPDEWYRRPGSRAVSMTPSESTLRRLSELENEDEDEEGTAKLSKSSTSLTSEPMSSAEKPPSPDSHGTFSTRRFSSLFGGWLGSSEDPAAADLELERKKPIVSEPVSMGENTGAATLSESDGEQSVDEEDFERMIVSLCLLWDRHMLSLLDILLKGRFRAEGRKTGGNEEST